ncbi:MAG TPA: STAS domain-containing protein [Syntrophorhabdaceae bacterium]|nr:STAS domain-containing protein [Syntrophorhabdaceae bacterium]HON85819.1 STAS domain-containing protein [Syntrophorhabdaceae bacterium]HOT42260.1 STAS domain-containing protein [Syntrophorhabdaceae bacterium]HPC67102.1 STAS domain-containing protein [Syntrophorhabdaceae bacterium]HPP41917.1 STAS domain-containing protein [Syntrophorhabdaceae bacterium]
MEIDFRKEGRAQIASVKGRIDAVTAPEFEKKMLEVIEQGERTILINMSGLEYISSAGLRSILTIAKKLKAENGEVFFAALQGAVEEVFKISGFHSIFKVFDSEKSALEKI